MNVCIESECAYKVNVCVENECVESECVFKKVSVSVLKVKVCRK